MLKVLFEDIVGSESWGSLLQMPPIALINGHRSLRLRPWDRIGNPHRNQKATCMADCEIFNSMSLLCFREKFTGDQKHDKIAGANFSGGHGDNVSNTICNCRPKIMGKTFTSAISVP